MKQFKLEDKIEDIQKKLYHNYEISKEELLSKIYRLNSAMDQEVPTINKDASSFPMWFIVSDNITNKVKLKFMESSTSRFEDLEFLDKIKMYLNSIRIDDKIRWCEKYGNIMEDTFKRHNGICKHRWIVESRDNNIMECMLQVRNQLFPNISTSEFCIRLLYGRMNAYSSTFVMDLIINIYVLRMTELENKSDIPVDYMHDILCLILNDADLDVDTKLYLPEYPLD